MKLNHLQFFAPAFFRRQYNDALQQHEIQVPSLGCKMLKLGVLNAQILGLIKTIVEILLEIWVCASTPWLRHSFVARYNFLEIQQLQVDNECHYSLSCAIIIFIYHPSNLSINSKIYSFKIYSLSAYPIKNVIFSSAPSYGI